MNDQNEKDLKREAITIYVVAGIVLLAAIYSDVVGYYQSLETAFHWSVAISISVALVLGFDLVVTIALMSLRNLFAYKKMKFGSWFFYLGAMLLMAWGAFHFGGLIMDNVHAVGAKRRAFVNAVDYSNDPLMVQGRQRLSTINAALEDAQKIIMQLSITMKSAGASANAFTVRAGDTLLSKGARQDQLWNATKANRTQNNVGLSLVETQKKISWLLTEKIRAQDWLDSVTVALDGQYRMKSKEDVIEAAIGRDLLKDISSATVTISILAIAGVIFIGIVWKGKASYREIEYESNKASQPPTVTGAGFTDNGPAPVISPPMPIKRSFADNDIDAACDWLEFLLITGQYIDDKHIEYDPKTGGSFSQTLRRVGGRNHPNQGRLSRRVKKVKDWMRDALADEVSKRRFDLINRHDWHEYAETLPVTPLRSDVAEVNGKLQQG